MSFPSENSVNYPSRGGSLNFYDDSSHIWLPQFDKIVTLLENNGIYLTYKAKKYQPILGCVIGALNERRSKKMNIVLSGTWAYWGFESIIWGKKN